MRRDSPLLVFCLYGVYWVGPSIWKECHYRLLSIHVCLPLVLSAHDHSNNDLRNTGFYWIVVNLTPLNMQSLFGKQLASTFKKSQLQNIITFFTFYYYSNKNTHYKTIFFFHFSIQFFSTWFHINHFLLLLKNKTQLFIKHAIISFPPNCPI